MNTYSTIKKNYNLSKSPFLKGLGSVLILSGSKVSHKKIKTLQKSDAELLNSDWAEVGQDILNAIQQFRSKHLK